MIAPPYISRLAVAFITFTQLLGPSLKAQSVPPPDYQPITWNLGANTAFQQGTGNVVKTGTDTTNWNADATSSQKIIRDGGLQIDLAQVLSPTRFAIGLSVTDSSRSFETLDYAFIVRPVSTTNIFSGYTVEVYESNVSIFGPVTYTRTSPTGPLPVKLSITRTGSQIRYWKDDTLLATSLKTSSGPLIADCSIRVGTLPNTTINTGDLDKDDMPDAWEKQNLPPNSGWTDLQNFLPTSQPLNPASDPDADGVSNLYEFLDGTNPNSALSYLSPVSWTALSSNTEPVAGGLGGIKKKAGTAAGWNSGGISTQKILEDGQLTFRAPLGSSLAVGLSDLNAGEAQTDLDFAVILSSNNTVTIKRPESSISAGPYTPETIFCIQRVSGRVQFLKDGIVIDSSTTVSSGTLQADCSLNAVNAQITECRIYTGDLDSDNLPDSWELDYLPPNATLSHLTAFAPGLDTPANPSASMPGEDSDGRTIYQEWLDGTNPTFDLSVTTPVPWLILTPSTIGYESAPTPRWVKYAGGTLWTNAEIAHATTQLPHSGRINFRIQSASSMAVGLTYNDGDRSRADLEFAISVDSTGNASVFESNNLRADLGTYTSNTTFSIQRLGGTISYLKDGIVYHTSAVPATAPLIVNTSFNTVNSALLSANITSGDLDGDGLPDAWEIALRQRQNLPTGSIAALNSTLPNGTPGSPGDPDSDGFTNEQEFKFGTDPLQGVIKPIPISWINRFNTSLQGLLGGLRKTTGTTGTFNADATSETGLPGDGRWNFTAAPNALAFGLTYANNSRAETDLEYAFVLSSTNSVVRRPESTTNLSTGSYTQSTVFGIQQTGSQIDFLRDGLVVYTSTTPVTSSLRADCSISTLNHQFDAVYQNSPDLDNDGLPDQWELHFLPLNATWQQLLNSHPNSDGPDNDGVNLWTEYQNGTSPQLADSDGDSIPDLWEIQHALAANDPTNTNTDLDGDGLTNLQESQLNTNPRSPDDTDNDGMWDGYEVTHSLARLDPNDALLDKDGDRIPNVWEFARSTSASDPAHMPAWDATVDASLPNDLPLEKRFRRLTEAVDSLPSDLNYRSLIRILNIIPAVGSNLLSPRSKVAIIGDSSPNSAPPQLDVYLQANADLYLDGIVLTRSPTSTSNYSTIQVARAFYEVPDDGNPPADPNYFDSNGSFYYYYYPDPIPRVRVVNCLFRHIHSTTTAFSPLPGALQNTAGIVSIEHCTFLNCGLRSSSSQTTGPSIRSTASFTLKNSIVWDTGAGTIPINPNPVNLAPNPQTYTVSSCLIQGGAYNAITANPNLDPNGYLTTDSDPCLASASPTGVLLDIMLQPRPQTSADLGPYQWLNLSRDTDQDGVPDPFEIAHHLNRKNSSDSQTDADNDGFTNKEEYDRGTDPNVSNTLPNAVPVAEFFTRNKGATFIDFENISEEGGDDGHIVAYVIYNHRGIQKWLTEFTLLTPTDQEMKDNLIKAKFDGYDGGTPSTNFPPFYPHQAFDENTYNDPALFPIPNDSDSLGWTKHTGIPDAPPGAFHDETEGGYYLTTLPDNWNPLPQISWTQIKVESPAPMLTEWTKSFLVVKHLEHTTEPPQVSESNLTNETVPLGTVTFTIPEGSRVGRVNWRPNTQTPISTTPDRVRIEELPPGKTQALVLEPYIRLENPELQSKQLQRSVSFSLLPVEFKKMWETKNKANQVFNPTRKDDPKASITQPPDAAGSVHGVDTNHLYVVVDPTDNMLGVTIDVAVGGDPAKWVAAAFNGGSKVSRSDTVFPASGPVEMRIPHGDELAIQVGYDTNSNSLLDTSEEIKLSMPSKFDKSANGEPTVKGISSTKYSSMSTAARVVIAYGGMPHGPIPHAGEFLRLFRDGTTIGMPADKRPTPPTGIFTMDAFKGELSEWLTHNSGAAFSDDGVDDIPFYHWDATTSAGEMAGLSHTVKNAVQSHFDTAIMPQVTAHFASLPPGAQADFPQGGLATITHAHQSTPPWVPLTTVLFDNPYLYDKGLDDVFGVIGRGRVPQHQAKYTVKKVEYDEYVGDDSTGGPIFRKTIGYDVTARTVGSVTDIYDFNYNAGTINIIGATLQLGYGKGRYGRTSGKIYRWDINWDETFDWFKK